MKKTIDVIVPVYRPDRKLEQLLYRLSRQSLEIRNIILMHTQDGCGLEWAMEKYPNIIVKDILPEDFDHGGTRDEGIRMSDADVIVCMTQDAVPADENLIAELTEKLGEDGIAAAYARQLPGEDCDILERYTRRFNYPPESLVKSSADLERLGIKTYFCSNVCAAYCREIYCELGGFESGTIFNEDMIYAAKLIKSGYSIAYCAKARVIHSHNYTNFQQFQRNFDMAVSQADHPEIFNGVKSETEGMRLVKKTAGYLFRSGHPFRLFSLFLKSGAKYAGYQAGLHYRLLPCRIVKKCTMNPRYWVKCKKPDENVEISHKMG